MKSGVPQGTVLGPLCFLLFINDLPDAVSPGTAVRLFADDCLLYRSVNDQANVDQLQQDLNAVFNWGLKWGMRFNVKKRPHAHRRTRTRPLNNTLSVLHNERRYC